jgi:exosortase
MLGLGWLLHTFGNRHLMQTAWHGGTLLLAVGALVTVVGSQVMWRLWPAFVALIFLLPVPATGRHLVAYPLQTVTAHATQACAEVLGMSVERTGNLLSINGTNVAIAEACNGMRMVFTLLLVCYTFAFTTPLPGYVRALVLILSPVMAVACNVIRLVPTIYVFGHASEEKAHMFHDAAGWVMLVVGYLLLMGIVRLVRWMTNVTPDRPARVVVAARPARTVVGEMAGVK